ncbi:RDD family protein [Wenxinia saemankumensis]|uniref:RDD family protein n=1 Tax=Wenxinia saemankumensis TaxID=1447782 RepID=A0A1M6AI91_9RHOB|nr:RDD family protein [Wenxinia saemankumensis]SHI36147.1 RDD family protein [Wenxinia saemankumensis]
MSFAAPFAPAASGLPDPAGRPEFYRGTQGKRAVAWVIDVALIWLATLALMPFTLFLGLFLLPVIVPVVGFLYRWGTIASGSATWGMRLTGIELRGHDGGRLSGGEALAHTGGYALSVAVFPAQLVSMALMAATPRGQGLTDHVLGTAAINRPHSR